MKFLKQSMYYTMLCLALVFTSCGNDDNGDGGDDGGDNGGGAEFVTAKVDGADFAAAQNPAVLVGATKANQGGLSILTVQGSNNDGDFINFTIVDYNGPGTYTTGDALTNVSLIQYGELTGTTGAEAWASNASTSAVGGLTPGEINVTVDADGVVEGTFMFEGYNGSDMSTKNITNGEFKANLDN